MIIIAHGLGVIEFTGYIHVLEDGGVVDSASSKALSSEEENCFWLHDTKG